MGNDQGKETEGLIKKRIFTLYCEQENIDKTVAITEDGLEFTMRGEPITIPFISITEVKNYKMWPCGCENFLYIGTSSGRYYYFSGKDASKFNKIVADELPEVEILL